MYICFELVAVGTLTSLIIHDDFVRFILRTFVWNFITFVMCSIIGTLGTNGGRQVYIGFSGAAV